MASTLAAQNVISVMIVDDHPVIRFGLRQMMQGHSDIALARDVEDIDQLIEAVRSSVPDIVVLDLQLGNGADGIQALRRLRELAPEVRVLIYTAHSDDECILKVAQLGVNGYLLKGCPMDELISAIRKIHAGGTILDPVIAGRLMGQVSGRAGTHRSAMAVDPLSEREIQVLTCLANGKSNRAIATVLHIGETTVKFHVHTILGKLRARNRTEAVAIGVKQGLIRLDAHP
jgi:DNA-binding NarL/FixJ family response regulator